MKDVWAGALADLYREVDAEMAARAPGCRGCGDCCRFDAADHILYASRLERLYIMRAADALPAAAFDGELTAAGLRCPFQEGDRCLARAARTLGCRLHFCSWPDPGAAEEMYERWHQRLKRLHEALGVDWDYAPLLPLMRNPKRGF